MIRLVEESEKRACVDVCSRSAIGCKIASNIEAYGFDRRFASLWTDDENAVYCLTDGTMMIAGTVTRADEALDFIRAVGAGEIICTIRNSDMLSLSSVSSELQKGEIMKKQTASLTSDSKLDSNKENEVDIRELYAFLTDNGMNLGDDFEPFYLDLSHKLRHGQALVFSKREENELAGSALVSAVSGKSVLLSAIAIDERYRSRGIGKELMTRVENRFPDRTIFIFKEKDKNNAFYRTLGFSKIDTWVTAKL